MAQMMEASRPAPTAVFSIPVPAGTEPVRAKIPAGTEQVRLQMTLEPGFDSLAVELKTLDGKTVRRELGRAGAFELMVPAIALPPGHYQLLQSGHTREVILE